MADNDKYWLEFEISMTKMYFYNLSKCLHFTVKYYFLTLYFALKMFFQTLILNLTVTVYFTL